MVRTLLICVAGACLLQVLMLPSAAAQEPAVRYGVAVLAGAAYDPDHIDLMLLQGQARLPYDQVFWHEAPDELYVKGEITLGLTLDGRYRGLAAVNMLAQYYLPAFRLGLWIPYVEGGIGVIYTDFQVRDQGLRLNFNPQLGVGVERPLPSGHALSAGVRLHHVSNGHLYSDNRGINSLLLTFGLHF